MASWPRFDLIESAYTVVLLAELTPAWRELYVDILDRLIRRYITWWGAADWILLKGRDPQRDAYPELWKGLFIPEDLFGDYEAPGWPGDGIEPWGHQPDPIGADGNLFYKGWLSLLLGLRERISGEGRWEDQFIIAPDADEGGWLHSQRSVNETLVRQWGSRPEGVHCENTKIWPFCLSAAGLGLFVHDGNTGGDSHWVFDQWFAEAQRRYLSHGADGAVNGCILYHDPIAGLSMPGMPPTDLAVAFYLTAQRPEVAEQLWSGLAASWGWREAGRPVFHIPIEPRVISLGRVMARELGDDAVIARLDAFADDELEPTWTTDRGFFFGFGLGEEHPRGQPNSTIMLAETIDRPGRWRDAVNPVTDGRFDQPTVSGVDFPLLGLHQAAFDPVSESLCVSTYAASRNDGGTSTFQITALKDAHRWRVFDNERPYSRTRVVDRETLQVTCSVAEHHFLVRREGGDA